MEDNKSEMNKQEMNDSSENKPVAADAEGKVTKKALTTRGMLLLGIGGLLVVLLIVGAVAWYTRISVVNQMSVDAAKFDFKANYTDDDFIIRAEDYINVYNSGEEGKAAPGTAGVIPILIQSGESNVDVNYILSLNTSGMDKAFKRRIRFFYIPSEDYAAATAGNVYHPEYEKEFTTDNTIKGTIKGTATGTGKQHYEYIYWEWVYDLNPWRIYDINKKAGTEEKWYIATDSSAPYTSLYNEYKDDNRFGRIQFDLTDTRIGRGDCDDHFWSTESNAHYNSETKTIYKTDGSGQTIAVEGKVKAYQKAMECIVDITGAMATPTYKNNPSLNPTHGVPDETGSYGSAYINLADVINSHNALYPADYWDHYVEGEEYEEE